MRQDYSNRSFFDSRGISYQLSMDSDRIGKNPSFNLNPNNKNKI